MAGMKSGQMLLLILQAGLLIEGKAFAAKQKEDRSVKIEHALLIS